LKFYTNFDLVGENALITGYEDGIRFALREKVKPYLFINSKNKDTHFRTIHGHPVDRIDFETPKEARDFVKKYNDVQGITVYGFDKFEYVHIFDKYRAEINYNRDWIRVVNIDIEVASDKGFPDITLADKEVTAITLEKFGKYLVLGCGDFVTNDPNVDYKKCTDEEHLLRVFLQIVNSPSWTPDAYTGWNIEMFDIPYLVNRITKILGPEDAKKISPWKILREKKVEFQGKTQTTYNPLGVAILDYIALYKKFTYVQRESYKLDYIAGVELGEKKIDYSEYGSLLDLYKNNHQKFIEYNIHDVRLIAKLDAKLKLIDLVYAMAYDAKINFEDCLTTVRQWDVICHNYLLERRRVVPQFKSKSSSHQIAGGFVKEPPIGTHRWIVSFDLTSLYPHLIMQYNISPETFVKIFDPVVDIEDAVKDIMDGKIDREKLGDYSLCANMTTYRRDHQGFLPALMTRVFEDRKRYKDEMMKEESNLQKIIKTISAEEKQTINNNISRLDNMQKAKKIQMNALYGALANMYFRWFEESLAEAITSSGQLSVKWIARSINLLLNSMLKTNDVDYVIAIDTDSVYLNLESFVKRVYDNKPMPEKAKVVEMLARFCDEKLEPYIAQEYGKLAVHMNAYEDKMKMKREVISDIGVWTGRKHYILNVHTNENVVYAEPKLKIVGLEAVRSSTPEYFRELLKACYKIVLNGEEKELQSLIANKKTEYYSFGFERVASPRGVNGIKIYGDDVRIYKQGTPLHTKGALLYNHLIKEMNLDHKYPYIYDGDKVKFSYLKKPNPIQDIVIASLGELPKEFGLDAYIDYDLQWERGFEQAIDSVLDARGWRREYNLTLDDFM
jgi:DNA polymerase elongation subunit (family B)